MTHRWPRLVQLCLVNMAIGGLAALPVNLFNRLMTVELALPAILPGLLVALHYGVQLTRPYWGYRSDTKDDRVWFIKTGIFAACLGVFGAAFGIYLGTGTLALTLLVWIVSYALIGLGIGAAGTSFLALLAQQSGENKGGAATLAWLFLIAGAIIASIGSGIALEPYSDTRLLGVVASVCAIAFALTLLATWGVQTTSTNHATNDQPSLADALAQTWNDPAARKFTGFVFLSILAFYLSELIFEPFTGHVHGLPPEASTKLSGGKDGAALMGMIAAGVLSQFNLGNLRFWAITGCILSALGLLALGFTLPLMPATILLGLGNGFFVVGAVGSMMQLAAAREKETGTRMGVFGAAQAIAAGLAGIAATATLDLARLVLSDVAAYATVFTIEAALFLLAGLVAARIMMTNPTAPRANLVPGE